MRCVFPPPPLFLSTHSVRICGSPFHVLGAVSNRMKDGMATPDLRSLQRSEESSPGRGSLGGQQMPWEFAWRKSVKLDNTGGLSLKAEFEGGADNREVIMKAGGVRTKILLGVNRTPGGGRHTGGGCKAGKVQMGDNFTQHTGAGG